LDRSKSSPTDFIRRQPDKEETLSTSQPQFPANQIKHSSGNKTLPLPVGDFQQGYNGLTVNNDWDFDITLFDALSDVGQ
jgi:hypothetical protein